jgi:hypothetical protein
MGEGWGVKPILGLPIESLSDGKAIDLEPLVDDWTGAPIARVHPQPKAKPQSATELMVQAQQAQSAANQRMLSAAGILKPTAVPAGQNACINRPYLGKPWRRV